MAIYPVFQSYGQLCQSLLGARRWHQLAVRMTLRGLTHVWGVSWVFVTTSSSLSFFTWWLQSSIRARMEVARPLEVLLGSHMTLLPFFVRTSHQASPDSGGEEINCFLYGKTCKVFVTNFFFFEFGGMQTFSLEQCRCSCVLRKDVMWSGVCGIVRIEAKSTSCVTNFFNNTNLFSYFNIIKKSSLFS